MKRVILALCLFPLAARAADYRNVGMTQNTAYRVSKPVPVAFGDSGSVDAFQRARVGLPKILFEATNVNGLAGSMESLVAGGGTVVYQSTTASAILGVGTSSGDRAIRQGHGYIMYQPGRSQAIFMTAVLGARQNGTVKRVGYFDDYNGLFFEMNGAGTYVVERSSVGASIVDTTVAQASWNLDPMDGTGPSGIRLDLTKNQIFVIDFQWLGVGRVRYGFDINGLVVYVHEAVHANRTTDVYMASPNLPVRFEIVNTGAVAAAASLKQICAAVVSEGGEAEEKGILFSTNTVNVTVNSPTTGKVVLAIRPSLTFSGAVNRVFILPQSFDIMVAGNVFYQIIVGGTLTGGAWGSVTGSAVEVNQGASYTANTGRILMSGYLGGATTTRGSVETGFPPISSRFALDASGTTQDTLCLVVYSFSGNEATSASVDWLERR
jgi:hypothetical protein